MFSPIFTLTLKSWNWNSVPHVKLGKEGGGAHVQPTSTVTIEIYSQDGPRGLTDFIFKIQLMHCFDSTGIVKHGSDPDAFPSPLQTKSTPTLKINKIKKKRIKCPNDGRPPRP